MFMLRNKNWATLLGVVIGIAILFIVVGIAMIVIGMLIDHECYQLQPNDFYSHSICEKYWDFKK